MITIVLELDDEARPLWLRGDEHTLPKAVVWDLDAAFPQPLHTLLFYAMQRATARMPCVDIYKCHGGGGLRRVTASAWHGVESNRCCFVVDQGRCVAVPAVAPILLRGPARVSHPQASRSAGPQVRDTQVRELRRPRLWAPARGSSSSMPGRRSSRPARAADLVVGRRHEPSGEGRLVRARASEGVGDRGAGAPLEHKRRRVARGGMQRVRRVRAQEVAWSLV